MHCRNCGKQIDDKAAICIHCGVPPRIEKKFCPNCGTTTTANQAICMSCGVALAGATGQKSKRNAILIGLFLGVLGGHKFYMGSWGWGIVQLVLTLSVVLSWISFIITFVDVIRMIMLSDDEFAMKAASFTNKGPFAYFW
jgi:TM2 domain-containing membrane protein YozV